MKLIAKAIVVSGLPIQKNVRYFNKFYTSEIKQKFKDLQKSVCPVQVCTFLYQMQSCPSEHKLQSRCHCLSQRSISNNTGIS